MTRSSIIFFRFFFEAQNTAVFFRNGFALLEVVIAAGIMSVLSLAMGKLIADNIGANFQLSDQLEKVQIIRNLETVLKDGVACKKTLGNENVGVKGSEHNISTLNDNLGSVIYSSNSEQGSLYIGQIKFE